MGYLTYDGVNIEFEDRVLLHVQIVIVQKLRRGDSFLMSWRDSSTVGSGRSSIWLSPTIPLYFKFFGGRTPQVNRAWIVELSASAESSQGLIVTAEPDNSPGGHGQPVEYHITPHRQNRHTTATTNPSEDHKPS